MRRSRASRIRAAARRSATLKVTAPTTKYPDDAARIKKQYFSSDDQLITMIMGGEIYLPGHEKTWTIGRDLGIPIAAHIVGASWHG